MKKIMLTALLMMMFYAYSQQDSYTLKEAVDYALTHNTQIRKADNEILKARKKVWETTAMGLPQVSGNVSYQRFIDKPVNLMPAKIFNPQAPPDTYIPVSFGTDQNMKWNLTVNQLVFSGSYITGLYSSRVYKQISELASEKTAQKVKEAVTQAYVNALLADKSLEILNANAETVRQSLFETRQMYENGFVEETDVKQLEITLAALENQLKYAEKMRETAYQMLNFSMGRNPDASLRLTDDLDKLSAQSVDLNLLEQSFEPEKNIDYLIAKNQLKSKKLMVRFEQSQMLPTIGAVYSYGKNAYNNEFKFFDEDQAWYKQSFIGLSINIPIFSALSRQKRVGQAKVDYENALMDFRDKQTQLEIQFTKLKNDYMNAVDKYHTQKKNLALAQEIERRERIKYKEGVGNSFQLNMARNQLYQTQQQYLQALAEVIIKKTELENFLNNEK